MAILNETYVMSTLNWWMVVIGMVIGIGGVCLCKVSVKAKSNVVFVILFILSIILTTGGIVIGTSCQDPKYQYPVGKKQIEAVFPMGKPGVNILDKYNVIEQRGRIWVLEEK